MTTEKVLFLLISLSILGNMIVLFELAKLKRELQESNESNLKMFEYQDEWMDVVDNELDTLYIRTNRANVLNGEKI
jgi:hypothetical protein